VSAVAHREAGGVLRSGAELGQQRGHQGLEAQRATVRVAQAQQRGAESEAPVRAAAREPGALERDQQAAEAGNREAGLAHEVGESGTVVGAL
jgi:hypothetical protein